MAKILLVEDDKRMALMLKKSLEVEGFSVDTAYEGDEALGKAKNNKYAVIVLDLMLPNRSGYDIISALRTLGNKTPILVVSARALLEDRVKALDIGADDYLVKYFSLKEFVARVRVLLRRHVNTRRNTVQVGDILIDLSSFTASKKGADLGLSKKELGILIELVRNKNSVLSREHLIESVWGEKDVDLYSNTVDVHIRSLRKKLNDPPKNGLIQTVRGYGYMLKD